MPVFDPKVNIFEISLLKIMAQLQCEPCEPCFNLAGVWEIDIDIGMFSVCPKMSQHSIDNLYFCKFYGFRQKAAVVFWTGELG